MKPCAADLCVSDATVGVLCGKHHKRKWRYGSPNYYPKGITASDRLIYIGWVVTKNGCWETNAHKLKKGYGHIGFNQSQVLAHRLAYTAWVGPIPEGEIVRHFVCDNPPCINPDHLRAGTVADNNRDRDLKGRGYSKLTQEIANDIREEFAMGVLTRRMFAEVYGVCTGTIDDVVTSRTWRNI